MPRETYGTREVAMKFKEFFASFEAFVKALPVEAMADDARYVILSDLHLGDGGKRDDLARNRVLVLESLRGWYLEKGCILVLNGDVEDAYKFKLKDVRAAWPEFFSILDEFAAAGRLRKIVGNHDLALLREKDQPYILSHGLVLERGGRRIVVFHGHQASRFFVHYDYISYFITRYLAKPLRIRNTSISSDSRHRYKAERRIYRASKKLGIVSIAGHTHRPLFESLSKYESLRWAIEDMLREYVDAGVARRREIAGTVKVYRDELGRLGEDGIKYSLSRSLYEDRDVLIPCVFNSGCATGKKGYTAIEIAGKDIELVHWGSAEKCRRYIAEGALESEGIEGTDWRRYVLRRDSLDRVFARIELLGGDDDGDEEDDEDSVEAAVAASTMNLSGAALP
jgi:UDP-2,3-diacylglucosamine pyrophosphatase LpxH